MKRILKRWRAPIIGAVVTVTTIGALAGVASAADRNAASGLKPAKSITVWAPNAPTYNWMDSLVSGFTAATGIKVNYQAIAENAIVTKLTAAQEVHSNSFDLFWGSESANSQYLEYHAIAPISQWLKDPTYTPASYDLSGLPASEFAGCTFDGKIYCIPMNTDTGPVLYYNTAMFKAAGLTPPTNWAQIETDANRLTALNGPSWCMRGAETSPNGYPVLLMLPYFLPYSRANLGEYLSPKGAPLFDTPGALTWAKEYAVLMQRDAPPGVSAYFYTDCLSAFQNGKIAMWWDTSQIAPQLYLQSFDPKEYQNIGIDEIPCPSFNETCLTSLPTPVYVNANVSPSRQLAAYMFAEWASSPANQIKALDYSKQLTVATRPATFQYALGHYRSYGIPTDFIQAAEYVPSHIEPNWIPVTAAFNPIQATLFVTLSELITASITPAQACSSLQTQMTATLKQYGLDGGSS